MTARLALAKADRYAAQLAKLLGEATTRIETAGALRRRQKTVPEIELVAIPQVVTQEDLFGGAIGQRDLLAEATQRLLLTHRLEHRLDSKGKKKWNSDYRRAWFRTDDGLLVPLDIWWATADNWGVMLARRTGPAALRSAMETSVGVKSRSRRPGLLPPEFVLTSDGTLRRRTSGEVIPCWEEADFLRIIGQEGISRPEDRK